MKQTIPAGEFKAKCLQLMDRVQQENSSIVITKHGKPVAQLIPFKEKNLLKPTDLFGYMSGTITILDDIVSPINESWDAETDDE